ncbi:MAG TPA: OmpA family protein [Candidatus Udaeobacter sp.]|nr:OmpA family protein [Candidatus Udaeobacter sp.]
MYPRRPLPSRLLIAFTLILFATSAAFAGLGDSIKKKFEKEAKKVDDATAKATGETEAATGEAAKPAGEEAGATSASSAPAGQSGSITSVSTKFDFVPGDSVILFDDFTQDELGEFPAQWNLTQGTFEVAESSGERWLRLTSQDGRVRMKLPAMASLPEFWTLELDFYSSGPTGQDLTVTGYSKNENRVFECVFWQNTDLVFRSGSIFSSTTFDGAIAGRHHLMLMTRGKSIKAYLDTQRMANVPEMWGEHGPIVDLEFRIWSSAKPMITNVRFAEGCRPPKDVLAEGKLVTHGIHFATGSDVVLPDSAPVLRQVAAYMQANPTVKLQVTGHTDNVGAPASNLDLSKRRAASVAKALTDDLKITADRFATDGKGDTDPMASNAKPEGRAMNRRVEFAKL